MPAVAHDDDDEHPPSDADDDGGDDEKRDPFRETEALLGSAIESSHPVSAEVADAVYQRAVRSARKLGLSDAEAEDAAMDLVVDAITRIESGRLDPDETSVQAWVSNRIRFRAFAQVERRRRKEAIKMVDAESVTEEFVEDVITRETLLRVMQESLSEAEVAMLSYFLMGWTAREVAKELGVNASTVRGRYQIALKKMRATLEERASTSEY